MSNRLALVPLGVLCAAAASLLLAACGGSSSPSSATSSAAKEQQAEVKFADFAKCLREHGVDAKTATSPGGGHGGIEISGGAKGPQALEAAQKDCKKYQPEAKQVNLSPQQKVEQEEAVQKFAKCMREHGIHVEASASGATIRVKTSSKGGGPAGAPNAQSPGFQKAQSSCQKLLPKPPGAPGGGPPGPPGSSKSAEMFRAGG